MSLTLSSAFDQCRARPTNRNSGLSAIASDGAMVLTCTSTYFNRPTHGVLRYEDRLSREAPQSSENQLLGRHLVLARDGDLPIRMVIATARTDKSGSRTFHVRPDLLGKVVKFDGDHYIVDFVRPGADDSSKRKRK